MSLTSESEQAEQSWSGWSRCGQSNLEWVEKKQTEQRRKAYNLEKTLLSKLGFFMVRIFKPDTYICWFSCEI